MGVQSRPRLPTDRTVCVRFTVEERERLWCIAVLRGLRSSEWAHQVIMNAVVQAETEDKQKG